MNREQFDEQLNELDTIVQALQEVTDKLKDEDDFKILKHNLVRVVQILGRTAKRIHTLYIISRRYIPKEVKDGF